MSQSVRMVAKVAIQNDKPTELTFSDLYTWVIWQFPRQKNGSLCGAVRPPITNHTWFPALIDQRKEHLLVHGHLDLEFSSPEDAANWLTTAAL